MMKNLELNQPFWGEYRQTLYHFILARVNDPTVAEDIIQDVLLKVYQRLNTLKNREKILPWMYQITRNAIVDYYRSHKPTEDIENTVVVEEMQLEENVEKELAQCLFPMLNQLPATYQQAVKMSEFDGLTQKEIAQAQGLSLSGVKSRVQRGRKLLKEMLMECCLIELDHQGNVSNYECKNC